MLKKTKTICMLLILWMISCPLFAQTPEIYSILESDGTLTYFYDSKKDEYTGSGTVFSGNEAFVQRNEDVIKCVFDPSFKDTPLISSFSRFFYYNNNMTSIEGLEHLNTEGATDMSEMFFAAPPLLTLT